MESVKRLLLTTIALLTVLTPGWAEKPANKLSPWAAIGTEEIWSVAWSPNGGNIAFVTADERGGDSDVDGRKVAGASVWIMKNPGMTGEIQLRKLASCTLEQGIPVGLFWLSEDEVGWAASAMYPKGFTLHAARLSDGNVRQITDQRFGLHYVDIAGNEAYDGPRDIYYDQPSGSIFFTGDDGTSRSDGKSLVCIGKYKVADTSLEVRQTTLKSWADICTYPGKDGRTNLFVCGLSRDPDAPNVIRSCSWPEVSQMKTVTPGGWFVRISPNGKAISWLDARMDVGLIVVYDLASKTQKVAAKWKTLNYWGALGCPYSWSPTGRTIAYSDGKQIYIVLVR